MKWMSQKDLLQPEQKARHEKDNRVMIAGKPYENLNQLTVTVKEKPYLYEDIYGREWAYEIERYPCFDVYDRMNEDRYYRWYVYRDGSDLWVVYKDDGRNGIIISENPEKIDRTCRLMLENLGWIEKR